MPELGESSYAGHGRKDIDVDCQIGGTGHFLEEIREAVELM